MDLLGLSSVSMICCFCEHSSKNLSRQKNTGSDRMRTISPAHNMPWPNTHWLTPRSSHWEQHGFWKPPCGFVCTFGVYGHEASEDGKDSEAATCESREWMRSSGTASWPVQRLREKSTVCLWERYSEGELEDALSRSICDILLTWEEKNVHRQNSALERH